MVLAKAVHMWDDNLFGVSWDGGIGACETRRVEWLKVTRITAL